MKGREDKLIGVSLYGILKFWSSLVPWIKEDHYGLYRGLIGMHNVTADCR